MKIQFESNQQFQLDAIQSTLDVFDGQPLAQGEYEIRFDAVSGEIVTHLGVGNRLALDPSTLLANVQKIQKRNDIKTVSEALDGMHFSLEMETGTGKTYVYLRTIYELHRTYGFKKFVIVVPSVAIREGVLKNIELTRDHFQAIYGNVPVDYWVYDSKQVSRLRGFANSNQLQILIINIDSFNKKENNVIHQERDQTLGRKPIEFLQATRPVVVVDEPQNMESDLAKAAIDSLSPLCTLRYSATHRYAYNLLYRLDPVKAYDLKLVKRIEVDAVLDDADFNKPFIEVKSVTATKAKITAKLMIDVDSADGPKRKTVSVSKNGTDLFDLSNERAAYRGHIVDHIDAGNGYVAFTNGLTLYTGQTHGGRTDEVMKVQIEETVKEHFEKELKIHRLLPEGRRLKVLSLFFIDRVANYYDQDGKIRKWFVEAYQKISAKPQYKVLKPLPVEQVHNGYFSQSKGQPKDTVLDGWRRRTQAKANGATAIDVCIRNDLADATADEVASEFVRYNLLRRQLRGLGCANCIKYLMETHGAVGGQQQELLKKQIGEQLGIGLRSVNRYLLILDAPPAIQQSFNRGEISLVDAGNIGKLFKYRVLKQPQQDELLERLAVGAKAKDLVREYAGAKNGRHKYATAAFKSFLKHLKAAIADLEDRPEHVYHQDVIENKALLKRGERLFTVLLKEARKNCRKAKARPLLSILSPGNSEEGDPDPGQ